MPCLRILPISLPVSNTWARSYKKRVDLLGNDLTSVFEPNQISSCLVLSFLEIPIRFNPKRVKMLFSWKVLKY